VLFFTDTQSAGTGLVLLYSKTDSIISLNGTLDQQLGLTIAGVTENDINANTIFYFYDTFNRLTKILDENKNWKYR